MPAPADVELDTAGAFRFLTETGPMLAGAGFGVLLPDWGLQSPARPQAHLTHPEQRRHWGGRGAGSGSGFGLHDLVQFRYDLAVADTTLDPGELAELARLKDPAGPDPRPVGGAGRAQPEGGAEVPGE